MFEAHETMFKFLPASDIFNSESNLLQRNAPVVITAQHLNRCRM